MNTSSYMQCMMCNLRCMVGNGRCMMRSYMDCMMRCRCTMNNMMCNRCMLRHRCGHMHWINRWSVACMEQRFVRSRGRSIWSRSRMIRWWWVIRSWSWWGRLVSL